MTNSKLSKTEQDLLDAIIEMLIDVEPETPEEVDTELRAMGLDPDEMSRRIESVVQDAWAKSPLNWRVQERRRIETERERYKRSQSSPAVSREDIIQRIRLLSTQRGSQFASAHRNLDEASDEDLASLMHQLEFLVDADQEEE